jgi:hypothetical protein
MELTEFLQNHLQKAGAHTAKTYLPFSCVEGGLPKGGLIEISGAMGGGKLEALLRFLGENPSLPIAWLEEGETSYPCAFPQHGVELDRVLFVNPESRSKESSQFLTSAHLLLKSQLFGALVLIPDSESLPHTTTTPAYPRDSRIIEPRGCSGAQQASESTSRAASFVRATEVLGASRRCAPINGARQSFGEIELRRLQLDAEKTGTTVFIIRETPSVAHTWPLAVQLQVKRVTPSLGDFRGELSVKILKYRSQPIVEASGSQALSG